MKKAVAIAMAFFLEDVNLGILRPCRRGDYPMRVGKLLCGKIIEKAGIVQRISENAFVSEILEKWRMPRMKILKNIL